MPHRGPHLCSRPCAQARGKPRGGGPGCGRGVMERGGRATRAPQGWPASSSTSRRRPGGLGSRRPPGPPRRLHVGRQGRPAPCRPEGPRRDPSLSAGAPLPGAAVAPAGKASSGPWWHRRVRSAAATALPSASGSRRAMAEPAASSGAGEAAVEDPSPPPRPTGPAPKSPPALLLTAGAQAHRNAAERRAEGEENARWRQRGGERGGEATEAEELALRSRLCGPPPSVCVTALWRFPQR